MHAIADPFIALKTCQMSPLPSLSLVGVTNPLFDTFPIDIWADGNCQKMGWWT